MRRLILGGFAIFNAGRRYYHIDDTIGTAAQSVSLLEYRRHAYHTKALPRSAYRRNAIADSASAKCLSLKAMLFRRRAFSSSGAPKIVEPEFPLAG